MPELEIELPKEKTSPFDDTYPVIKDDNTLSIFVADYINQPFEMNKAVHELSKLTPDDRVLLYLNTPGGVIDTANYFCAALERCQAPVHGLLSGSVCSSGSLITMYCDTIEVADGCQFMIHNYSGGVSG